LPASWGCFSLTCTLFCLILRSLFGGLKMVNWEKAFEVFFIGFGGVFVTLIILQLGISLYSKIINRIENVMKKKG
jgi:hypothetical protein